MSNANHRLICRAIQVYKRAYNREAIDYINKDHWSRRGKRIPPASWEQRYPVASTEMWCA